MKKDCCGQSDGLWLPWWAVISGTFLVIIIGKQIFGGIGSNAFHPVALAMARQPGGYDNSDPRGQQAGLTGWAQLRYPYGATYEDAKQKLQYDLYYVKNASLFLDLVVLLETVEVVLWGKGAR